ncbi:hypothetical protein NEOLEDRAFT_1173175 [Neolentinus lepideus HHB14362 ss-1]|uniref:Amine oxidase domain-containing protein n=1 Tax=Neolentinus lepideus HHB14362 ss-1 TaxID=1314782 RepID=A0A165N530_9AGAM|nr:hypothetical protein NEOLEDRAFT_1173175 [Neolentinus lepideus HHB14362 ss-1]
MPRPSWLFVAHASGLGCVTLGVDPQFAASYRPQLTGSPDMEIHILFASIGSDLRSYAFEKCAYDSTQTALRATLTAFRDIHFAGRRFQQGLHSYNIISIRTPLTSTASLTTVAFPSSALPLANGVQTPRSSNVGPHFDAIIVTLPWTTSTPSRGHLQKRDHNPRPSNVAAPPDGKRATVRAPSRIPGTRSTARDLKAPFAGIPDTKHLPARTTDPSSPDLLALHADYYGKDRGLTCF